MATRISRGGSLLAAFAGFVALSIVAAALIAVGLTPAVVATGQFASVSVSAFDKLPEFIEIGRLQQRNILYANRGGKEVPFATLYNENRVTLTSDEVSHYLKEAAVAGEDRRFFEHGAVDVQSLARAAVGSLANKDLGATGGGSTIAMQLVRNILVAQAMAIPNRDARKEALTKATEETFRRKLAEMKLAIGLEKRYSKDEVLLAYLNIAYFGDNAYGVEAASQRFYGKSARDLTAAEAASLLAIVQFPEDRNLSSPTKYAANKARRDVVLSSMLTEKKIDQQTYDEAVATPVESYVHLTPVTQGCMAVTEVGAQQWCDLIRRTVQKLPSLGKNEAERARNWRLGGYHIKTTLDLDLNAAAKEQLLTYAPNTETRYKMGGVVASVEAKTGRVIVLTQNKDFDEGETSTSSTATALNYAVDKKWGGSNGFQPGSTYKPFTLLEWLKQGHGLSETVDATPRNFAPMMACKSPSYAKFDPKNFDFGNPGIISAQQATVRSINTGYAAMAQKLDLCDIRKMAKSLGVHTADGSELSLYPSAIIGSADNIAPLTMASAFSGIANGGVYCSPVMIDSIVDSDGTTLPGEPQNCKRVMNPTVAARAAVAMQGVFNGGSASSANPRDGVPVLGKTGTTDNAEQTWLVGSSSNVSTASWVGNLEGHQNQYRISGKHGQMSLQRMTIWKNMMRKINAAYGGSAFPAPPPEAGPPKPTVDADGNVPDYELPPKKFVENTVPRPEAAPKPESSPSPSASSKPSIEGESD